MIFEYYDPRGVLEHGQYLFISYRAASWKKRAEINCFGSFRFNFRKKPVKIEASRKERIKIKKKNIEEKKKRIAFEAFHVPIF